MKETKTKKKHTNNRGLQAAANLRLSKKNIKNNKEERGIQTCEVWLYYGSYLEFLQLDYCPR